MSCSKMSEQSMFKGDSGQCLKVSINDNEDKKIFVVPLAHTLKEDIEREVIIMMMMMMIYR